MLTSIEELLEKNDVDSSMSIYKNMPREIREFPMTIGDFVEVVDAKQVVEQFELLRAASQMLHVRLKKINKYAECGQKIALINEKMKEASKARKNADAKKVICEEERIQLKKKKKLLKEQMDVMAQNQEKRLSDELGYDWKELKGMSYKRTVYFTWMEDMKRRLPLLKRVKLEEMFRIPWAISGIDFLEEAITEKQPVGMIGGPCLFGIDEVLLHVENKDGTRVSFDCSCGRRCLNEKKTEATLEEYLMEYSDVVEELFVENRKDGITRQEYDSMLYLFEMAAALEAKVVIPLPDMSYFKYMESDLKGLKEEKKNQILEVFRKECYQITDLYLEVIEEIAALYPQVEYKVMHERNRELCTLFYEKRAPHITKSSYIQKITNKDGKKDAVIDYITMLALPYYVYGTRCVVQLDSIDEVDSGRKCRKIHKNDITHTQILYPERLSRDGKNTIYSAPFEFKDYVRRK